MRTSRRSGAPPKQWAHPNRPVDAGRNDFKHRDGWHDGTEKWLDEGGDDTDTLTPRTCGKLTSEQVLVECCGMDPHKIMKRHQQRIAEVLKALGMKRIQRRIAGRNTKVWVDAGEAE